MKAIYPTAEAFQTAFAEYSQIRRQLAAAESKANAKLAAIKAKHTEATAPLAARLQALEAGVKAYAEHHRAVLTNGGKSKTATVGSGCIKWRKQPARVEITGDIADILAALKRRRLNRFIRVKEELNKPALLKDAAAIKTPISGLQIVQGGESISIETGSA